MCNLLCNCEDAQQFRYITCPAVKAYLSTFTDGPAYVEFDWRVSFLNKHLRSENSMRGDREYLICALVFKCAIRCDHASPAHTTRVLIALIRGGVKHLPNDLTNSSHRKWAGLWEENSRHRMARHRAGPVDTPGTMEHPAGQRCDTNRCWGFAARKECVVPGTGHVTNNH